MVKFKKTVDLEGIRNKKYIEERDQVRKDVEALGRIQPGIRNVMMGPLERFAPSPHKGPTIRNCLHCNRIIQNEFAYSILFIDEPAFICTDCYSITSSPTDKRSLIEEFISDLNFGYGNSIGVQRSYDKKLNELRNKWKTKLDALEHDPDKEIINRLGIDE